MNSYEVISEITCNITQVPKKNSILFQGLVTKIIDEDFICYMESIDQYIYVSYEQSKNELYVGDKIKFSGELKVEISRKAVT